MKKILFILFMILIPFVLSADFTPQGDLNLRGVYAIKNATTINSTGNISTISWFEGLFNWTIVSDYFTWTGSLLSFSETKLNATIDNRAGTMNDSMKNYVDTQNTSQTNAMTDQNTSQTNYIGVVNDSMNNYILSQNLTWFTTWNATTNTTLTNSITAKNVSMGN